MKFKVSNFKRKVLFPAIIELTREAIFALPDTNDPIDAYARFAIMFFLIVLGLLARK